MTEPSGLTIFIIIVILAGVYVLPSLIGSSRDVKHTGLLFFGNIVFGCTGILWFIALIYACAGQTKAQASQVRTVYVLPHPTLAPQASYRIEPPLLRR